MGTPVPVPAVALLAMRIKASGQLSGALDEVNVRIDAVEIDARAVGQLECRLSSDDPTYNIQLVELRLAAEEVA
jgi:hypothetical protein